MRVAIVVFLVVVIMLAGAGVLTARLFKPAAAEIPSVLVRRGDFLVKTHAKGDLRAVSSSMVTAPNVGGSLVITTLTSMGAQVKKDEVVLAFDPAELQNNLESFRSRQEEAEQEIKKNRLEAAIREQNDKVELMKAEFAVRRAELDVSRNELVSEIDAKKNLLALAASRKRLAQLRQDVQSRRQSSEAELAVAKEKANKAAIDMKQAQQRIDQITVKAAMDGLVNIRQNRSASGGFWFPGIDLPDYRVGDQAFSGETVMEVVDTGQMEVAGKVNESDRGNLKEGQEVLIRVNALPGETLPGKVKSLAGMTSRTDEFVKMFDVVFSLTKQDSRLRPGMSAEVQVITERIPNVLYVPQQAVFDKEGKKWVYAQNNGRFERREVTAGRRSESQVQIAKGLNGGEVVALVDPEAGSRAGRRGKNPLASSPIGGR